MHAVPLPPTSRTASRRAASLSMYDLPELRWANDRLWTAIAERLEAAGLEGVPHVLERQRALDEIWTDPRLLLAHSCGYPLVTSLRGRVQLVATPRYRAEGCRGPFHSSAIAIRKADRAQTLADLKGTRLALNEEASGSGMNLMRAAIAPLAVGETFFSAVSLTGSHLASLHAVAAGEADVAAVDSVTWAHVRRLRPHLADRIRVLAWTAESPGLPLITAGDTDAPTLAALREALVEAACDPHLADVRDALLLEGFSVLREPHYQAVSDLAQGAVELGYPLLR